MRRASAIKLKLMSHQSSMAQTFYVLLCVHVALAWDVTPMHASGALVGRAHRGLRPVVAMQGHAFDDDDDPQVSLIEEDTGRVLPCYIAASVEYEGITYAALYPVNVPVSLAGMGEEEQLVPLDADQETPALVQACKAACAEADIELIDTPVVYTACGRGLELADDEMEALQFAADGDDDDDDDEAEEALVLAELVHEGANVLVVQTLDPLYVVGKQSEDGSSFTVPTDEEIALVSDTIEQLVEEFEDGFGDGEDDEDFDEFAP